MPSIDWRLREAMPHMRDNGRFMVLFALILRANVRNRCWPSMDLICKDTGYAIEAVNEAKKWLIKHGAIEMVEFKHRVGKECELPPRQSVYQLTGVIKVENKVTPYLYISTTETSESETSSVEISTTEDEVVKAFKSKESSKTKKKREEKETTIAPAIANAGPVLSPNEDDVRYPFVEQRLSTSVPEGKIENPAQAEKQTKGKSKAKDKDTTPLPPSAATGKQSENRALAEALGQAWGGPIANSDFALYIKQANDLVKDVPVEEFKAYCDWRKAQAGDWASRLTIGQLLGKGYVSEYLKQRTARLETERKQKENEEQFYARHPDLRPRESNEPVEYASPEEVKALIAAAMRPSLAKRQENAL